MPSVEVTSNHLYFNVPMHMFANVGIGTSTPQTALHIVGDTSVQGHILPIACNVYDLGSSDFRFRDIYLSGTTIDLEGTQIAKDNDTGGISFKDAADNYLDARVGSLVAYGNVGIGTTNPTSKLEVKGLINNVNLKALDKRTKASYASAMNAVSTWSDHTNLNNEATMYEICWSPKLSLFCAVGPSSLTNTNVLTSPNGVQWTSRTSADSNAIWYGICWSPELSLFCATGYVGDSYAVMTSPDGINWTGRNSVDNSCYWTSVCWSPELSLFCAVGSLGSTYNIMTSPDGVNWTGHIGQNGINPYSEWRNICWSPELSLFCAVSWVGTRVMTSPDGINWTGRTSANDNTYWESICWSPELSLFCAAGNGGGSYAVMTSPDGIHWTGHNSVNNYADWWSICWSPELSLFCCVGTRYGGNYNLMTSPDGINWTSHTGTDPNAAWYGICWSPELSIFTVVGDGSTTKGIMTSAIGMPNYLNVVKALPSQMVVDKTGNVGIGTTNSLSTLHVVAPKSFQFNSNQSDQFDTGSYDVRMLSTSADGNTVVVSKANQIFNNLLEVFAKQDDEWVKTTLTIQNLPSGLYDITTSTLRIGSRGFISNDGNRIVASSGRLSGDQNANVCEVFHYINNAWVSKAYIHASGCLGWGSAISGDGNTIALTSVVLPFTVPRLGTLYVYRYNAQTDTWDQTLSRQYDNFPDQVTLNNDGSVLALSRTNSPSFSYSYSPSSESIIHILKYTNNLWNDAIDDIIISPPNGILNWHYYGKSLKISSDGLTLVVGAPGFGANAGNYNVLNAVFVYKATDTTWQSYSSSTLQPESYSNPTSDDRFNQFGNVISVNEDGTIIVAGAQSADVFDQFAYNLNAGKVWMFKYINSTWTIIGTLDGTESNGAFGSAVDLTTDGYSLYVASRGLGITISWGIYKYDFSNFGSAMKAIGSTWLTDMMVDGTTVLSGSIDMNVRGDCFIRGNVGIGTTSSAFTMRVDSSDTYSTASYEVITYQNYMLWDAYTNRLNLPIHNQWGYPDYAVYKIPDLGFDFFIHGKNYRSEIYVAADGIVSFGGYKSAWGTSDFYVEDWSFPAFSIGLSDQVVNSVSYYTGSYNQEQAVYIFYDARDYYFQTHRQKWCLILQSNNKIDLLINEIKVDYNSYIGIANGDNKTWLLQLPRNGTVFDPPLTSVGYSINIYQNRSIGSYVRGNMHVSDVLHTTTIGDGVIVPYPPVALNSNVSLLADAKYGNGEYIVSASSSPYVPDPIALFNNNDTEAYYINTGYDYSTGQYTGYISTTFTDFTNVSTSIMGEWVQIQLPKAIRLYSYGLTPFALYYDTAPYKYVLLGSSDGDTWTLLDDHRTSPTIYQDSLEVINLVSTYNTYSYYRFVVYAWKPQTSTEWTALRFYAYNDPLQIDNSMQVVGSVGIGTSTPEAPLHLIGNMKIQGNIIPSACNVYDLGSSTYRFRDLYLSGNTIDLEGTTISKDETTGGISITDGNNGFVDTTAQNLVAFGNVSVGSSNAQARLYVQHTGTGNIMQVDDSTTPDSTPFIINQDGNVGIGSSIPQKKLHVVGDGRLEGDLFVSQTITASTMISSNLYVVGDVVTMNTLSSNTEQMVITNAGTGPALKVVQTGLMSIHTIAEFVDAEDGLAMIIANGGSVGIGTSTPQSKLDVIGTIKATDFTGNGAALSSLNAGNISAGTLVVGRGGIGTATLTANKLLVGNGTSAITQPTELHWDGANLGIGTITPLAKTHIYHTGNGDIFRVDDQASDTTPVVITQDGNVGIGTNTNVLSRLHVPYGGGGLGKNTVLIGNNETTFGDTIFSLQFGAQSKDAGMGVYSTSRGVFAKQGLGIHITETDEFSIRSGGWAKLLGVDTSTVYVRGNLGIGNTQPSQALDVSGSIRATANVGVGTATPLASMHVYSTGAYDIMRVDDSTAPDSTPFIINQDGNVGIGTNNPLTYKLAVDGAIYATGDVSGFGTLSDVRYKENIKELDRSLQQIRELRPVDFHWKSNVYYEQRKGTQDVGFIAQEMEEVLPLVIRKLTPPGVEEELKGVAYEKLTPYIIKAIQELDQNYQQLRKDFAELQQKLSG